MKAQLVFIILFLVSSGFISAEDNYAEREVALLSDSSSVHDLLNIVKTDFVRKEIEGILTKISDSKKIFKPFRIDFYTRKKHNYELSGHKEMTVSELLDSLSRNIEKAKILRINKLDLNGSGDHKTILTDNSFKDLEKETVYRKKEELLKIIEETALSSNKKSSLEWIWGRSPEEDAYYSTKLTYYDDRFSLYPEYRFFVGNDPLRDRNGWFFSLSEHSDIPQIITAENVPNIQVEADQTETADLNVGVSAERVLTEEFDCGASDYSDIEFETDMVVYKKNPEGGLTPFNRKMKIGDMLDSLCDQSGIVKFVRLTSTDFSFEGNEVRKTESESIIEVSGNIGLCFNRIKSFLAEGMTDAGRKRSVEFITDSNSDKLSYNAAIVTVYDGQTSCFQDYKIYASSGVRKDKNSWFNNL